MKRWQWNVSQNGANTCIVTWTCTVSFIYSTQITLFFSKNRANWVPQHLSQISSSAMSVNHLKILTFRGNWQRYFQCLAESIKVKLSFEEFKILRDCNCRVTKMDNRNNLTWNLLCISNQSSLIVSSRTLQIPYEKHNDIQISRRLCYIHFPKRRLYPDFSLPTTFSPHQPKIHYSPDTQVEPNLQNQLPQSETLFVKMANKSPTVVLLDWRIPRNWTVYWRKDAVAARMG